MRQFIRREWPTIVLWSLAGALLWYALAVDRSKLTEAYGFIATSVFWEITHRLVGPNRRDRQS